MEGSPTPDDVTTPSSFLVFGTRKIIPTIFLLIFVGTLIMLAAAAALVPLPQPAGSSDFCRLATRADAHDADDDAGSTSISVLDRSRMNNFGGTWREELSRK